MTRKITQVSQSHHSFRFAGAGSIRALITSILFLSYPLVLFAQNVVSLKVTEFGAKGDGVTLNTIAIQKAIDSVSTEGGAVIFTAGKYLTGSLYLRSNVTIYLDVGATILGSGNLNDYQAHIPKLRSYNDSFLRYSLFYSEGEKNISIMGQGVIDGQGGLFKVKSKSKPDRYENRPFVIRFVKCRNVKVEGITLRNSAMWMEQYLACEDLIIRGISVFNHANMNNDMMDIDGCKNVIISGCHGDSDDDGIVLKSTSQYPDQNITVTNCVLSSHCNAIKLGTESMGGFKDINISDIVVKPSSVDSVIFGYPEGISGISISEVDGGILSGVNISDIVMDGPQVPIFIRLGDMGRKYDRSENRPDVGKLENVTIRNVLATNIKSIGCSITGLSGHPVNNVSLSDINIVFDGGVGKDEASELPQELRDHYPESTMWGKLPAYGFFVRDAKDISFDNVHLTFRKEDSRPVLYCRDVNGLNITGLIADVSGDADGFIELSKVSDAVVQSCRPMGATMNFIHVDGLVKRLSILSNDARSAKRLFYPSNGKEIRAKGNLLGK